MDDVGKKGIIFKEFSELDTYYAINDGEEIYMDALANSDFNRHCYACANFNQDKFTCPAFENIPVPFRTGEEVHYRRVEGQKGDYIFTKKKS